MSVGLRELLFGSLLLAAGPGRAATYLCFGDSITYGSSGGSREAYLGHLQDYLNGTVGNAVMRNEGKSGEITSKGVSRLSDLVQAVQADFVLIMEGTNDLYHWGSSLSIDQSEENLRSMVRTARAAGAVVVIATVPPRYRNDADPNNVNTRRLNERIRALAPSEGALLAEVYGSLEPYAGPFTYTDSLHPNSYGYYPLAEAFASALAGTDVDLAPPLPVEANPMPRTTRVPINTEVRITLRELKHPQTPGTGTLLIDGAPVTAEEQSRGPGDTTYVYKFPANLRFGQTVSVTVHAPDTNVPPRFLEYSYSFTTSQGNGSNGDIDRSGRIDGIDLSILAGSFGASQGDPRYLFEADIDGTSTVDGLDLMILASRFGGSP